jgi:hypothetical protein
MSTVSSPQRGRLVPVRARISPADWAELQRLSAREDRSISQIVRQSISRRLLEAGALDDPHDETKASRDGAASS